MAVFIRNCVDNLAVVGGRLSTQTPDLKATSHLNILRHTKQSDCFGYCARMMPYGVMYPPWSALDQEMDCCLKAPSHYQCWPIVILAHGTCFNEISSCSKFTAFLILKCGLRPFQSSFNGLKWHPGWMVMFHLARFHDVSKSSPT